MRILFWTEYDTRSLGGVEVFVRTLADGLIRHGHEVHLVCERTAGGPLHEEVIDGIHVHRFEFYAALASRSLQAIGETASGLGHLKQTLQPDIVHINLTGASPFFHLRTPVPGSRVVLGFHDDPPRDPDERRLPVALARAADVIVAPSNYLAGHLQQALGPGVGPMRVIEHGVADEDLLAVPPLPGDDFVFLLRLVPEKGWSVALGAAALLRARGELVHLRIHGAGPDLAAAHEAARQLDIEDVVVFGRRLMQSELAGTLATARAVIVPSLVPEAFGLIAIEAALAGRAVIASNSGAMPELVVDGETGLLVPPNDPAALAEAMRLLAADPGLAERLGTAARQRARGRFGAARMVADYEALYADLCALPQRGV